MARTARKVRTSSSGVPRVVATAVQKAAAKKKREAKEAQKAKKREAKEAQKAKRDEEKKKKEKKKKAQLFSKSEFR